MPEYEDALLKELEEIHDGYMIDVKQFVAFMKENRLPLAGALKEYAFWLDGDHDGKRYSPATFNRKIAAAKSRIRYAFKHGSFADSLRSKYQLEEILKEVKLKHLDPVSIPAEKSLSIEEVKKLAKETRDATIGLMVRFLVGTGVRISEMLSIKLSDLRPGKDGFVQVRIIGKGGKERLIHVNDGFVDHVRSHFKGTAFLFEHDGRAFSRISVTNRIKHESLRIIGREVSAQQLRYTWAKVQIRRGKNLRAVASSLGYTDSGLTARLCSTKPLVPQDAFLDVDAPERSDAV